MRSYYGGAAAELVHCHFYRLASNLYYHGFKLIFPSFLKVELMRITTDMYVASLAYKNKGALLTQTYGVLN